MFYYVKNSIDNIVKYVSKFVIGENKFIRESKFSFKDYVTFFCFNKGTSNQADLEDFIEDNFTQEIEEITRQTLSKQRTYINPTIFKEINEEYLRLINYNTNNSFFNEYKGFRLFGGDGSDFEIPDFEEVRSEFGIKNTPKYRKPAIGNYKQAELPLMHQNLENIKDLITPEKSIFIFDRGYNAMELYAHIISINSYFIVKLKDKSYIDERYTITENDSKIKKNLTEPKI